MRFLFALLCIAVALLMVVLLEIEVDIKFTQPLLVVLHIGIFAVELRTKRKRKHQDTQKDPSATAKIRKSATYLKFIITLIEGSEIRVNRVELPDVLPEDAKIEYIKDAAYSGIISLFLAYLTSKSLKLKESDDAYNGAHGTFIVDVTLKTQIIHVIKTYFIMRKRFAAIREEETG